MDHKRPRISAYLDEGFSKMCWAGFEEGASLAPLLPFICAVNSLRATAARQGPCGKRAARLKKSGACTHCCLPALAATAPGLATQRHHAPASGSAPGSRPGAQLPLGDGPLSRSYRQLGSDLTRRKCTACALLPASSVLQSGGYRCHPHHRRNGICSPPIAGFV